MVMHIPDISEYQRAIDWKQFGASRQAVIVRASFGTNHIDHYWDINKDGARKNVKIRGWYQYVVPNQDILAQADVFCALVGHLQLNEFAALDIEQGDGDQTARALAWLSRVDSKLGGSAWIYTYWPYATAHLQSLRPFKGRYRWIAAYQNTTPNLPLNLWQHTDKEQHPGIPAPCDCSIFAGSPDDFIRMLNPGVHSPVPVPVPNIPSIAFPEEKMHKVPVQVIPLGDGTGYWDLDGVDGRPKVLWGKYISSEVNGGGVPKMAHTIEASQLGDNTRLWFGNFESGAKPLVWVTVAD